MAKYTETQTRKVISSYGGVESIIETPKGALKIEPFDKWPFFRAIKDGIITVQEFVIDDNRLLKRLQSVNGFPKLKEFLRVPPNHSHPTNKSIPLDPNVAISSEYFPRWFYCNNCESFNDIQSWWNQWKMVVQKHGEQAKKSDFIPPKCPRCYDKAKTENKQKGKRTRFNHDLEQVRFVMTSPTGEIRDIPWERWNKAIKNDKENKEESVSGVQIDFNNLCCDNQDLKYYKSKKFSDLSGIRIECKSCGSRNTLSGFFGLKIGVTGKTDSFFKPVLRTSNSCYYPILVSSIYLPTKRDIDIEDRQKIERWLNKEKDLEFIWEALEEKYEIEKIRTFIEGEIKGEFEPEIEYRLKEFLFITDPAHTKYPEENSNDHNLVFERIESSKLEVQGIKNLTAVKRLKITTVQTAFTRQEPVDNDQFLSGEMIQDNITPQYTSEWGNQTEFLPAIESFGEGVFLSIDLEKINSWFSTSIQKPAFSKRIKALFNNSKNSEIKSIQKKFNSEKHLVRFVLIHTLSHLIMKELEFLCGYPATSLNERLFVDEEDMAGLLIYTVAGSEGSYGGLVSQATEFKLNRLLNSALLRAEDCSSDPICYNTDDGQGIGGLNMAACYSCTLVPENACEEFNSFLDRSLLIDPEYGFFRAT